MNGKCSSCCFFRPLHGTASGGEIGECFGAAPHHVPLDTTDDGTPRVLASGTCDFYIKAKEEINSYTDEFLIGQKITRHQRG